MIAFTSAISSTERSSARTLSPAEAAASLPSAVEVAAARG
ncbi:hypothetical protein C8E87_0465 [Paractinoplanes brasiliensis]|uniref:Uncharacterized protein n=1 Tax=Paractinoplanes brasiliensis TaxID=52695 RepID=A0A4V3C795_9ACTN|nr:hypothetical protein C8E87_0465 [Actinoplanes brasiliensis]